MQNVNNKKMSKIYFNFFNNLLYLQPKAKFLKKQFCANCMQAFHFKADTDIDLFKQMVPNKKKNTF